MRQIDWNEAPEGATHYGPAVDNMIAKWFMRGADGCWDVWGGSGWSSLWTGLTKGREDTLIQRPPIQEWTGEGLPPVGTVCICTYLGADLQVRILGIDGKDVWCHGQHGKYTLMNAQPDSFRPIRTPEQIEADERSKTRTKWYVWLEEAYGESVADKCDDILVQAEKHMQVKP